jgi:hypothetical protein
MKKSMTLGEIVKRKDFICSTNVERTLYNLLTQCGIGEIDVLIEGTYDKQVGEAKERIYKEFSKACGFKYKWDGFYEIKEKKA